MKAEHAVCTLNTHHGRCRFHCFSFGKHEEENVLCIESGDYKKSRLVRVQSACYTSEIFRSKDCDCHEQLHSALARIQAEGGLLIYMLCDGRGAGLLTKVRGLALGESKGLDTYDAYAELGVEKDPRIYDKVVHVLKSLDLTSVRLLTNNPKKLDGLTKLGISAERVAHEFAPTPDSERYLTTKRDKGGHLFTFGKKP